MNHADLKSRGRGSTHRLYISLSLMFAQFALGFAISNVIVVLTSSMTFKGVSERAKKVNPSLPSLEFARRSDEVNNNLVC